MEFFLKTTLITSSDISYLHNNIKSFLNDLNDTILTKGAPSGKGSKIIQIDLNNKEIKLTIISQKYVRAHDALLRIKKHLSNFLGVNYKIGIRNIVIDEFYITILSDKDIINKSLPYVKNIEFENKVLKIILDVNENDIRNQIPDRIINLIEDKLEEQNYGSKTEHWNLLWESNDKNFLYNKNPTEDMLNKSWIQRGSSRGQWIHGPQSTRIFKAFEKIVEIEIIDKLKFEEMIFPKLVTWDIWKNSGHAKGIYPEMYYVCAPKTRDPKYWEDVIDYYKITNEVPVSLLKDKISEPIGGLCYAQCPPSWLYFKGKTISNDSIPIKIFDRSGTSHRYESGGIHGIERVDEFHRIELVWIGKQEMVIDIAEKLHEYYMYIFNEILDLKWRKAWVTPWFMAQEGLVGLSNDNKVGTTDYEAILPYRINSNSEWLEFQNLSINGSKYPNGFNVKLQSGDQLWSGCSGIGLERWEAVFLAQHGLNYNDWPEKFKYYFGNMPKNITFL